MHIPDMQKELWSRFRSFASSMLPRKSSTIYPLPLFSQNSVKDNCTDMAAITPPVIMGATVEQDTSECPVDIPCPASQRVDDEVDTAIPDCDHSETMIGTISPVRTTTDNESDKGEIFSPKVAATDTPQNGSPVPSSRIPCDHPQQQVNSTDERLAFAIASALSAVTTLDGPAVTQEQEQPPKAQRKRHAKSAAVKQNLVKKLPTIVPNARPVKRKDRERVSPQVEPPVKKSKTKTPLEPSMRVSAR